MNIKNLLFIYLSFVCFSLSAQPDFYKGSIHDKIGTKMNLSIDTIEQKYTGNYININEGYFVSIESKPGTLLQSSKEAIILYKAKSYQRFTDKIFKGTFSKDGKFSGTWYSDQGEALPFSLFLNNTYRTKYDSADGFKFLQITGMADINLQKEINQRLRAYKRGRIEEIDDTDKYETFFDFDIIFFSDNIITVLQKSQKYHSYGKNKQGYYEYISESPEYVKYWALNLTNGNFIRYSDIFNENGMETIKTKIRTKVDDITFDEEVVITAMESVCITEAGIMFPLPISDSYIYEKGDRPYIISYEEVLDYISPEGLLRK